LKHNFFFLIDKISTGRLQRFSLSNCWLTTLNISIYPEQLRSTKSISQEPHFMVQHSFFFCVPSIFKFSVSYVSNTHNGNNLRVSSLKNENVFIFGNTNEDIFN